MDSSRRSFLLGAAGTATGLSGCLGLGSGGGAGGSGSTATPAPWSLPDHPALADVDTQPFVGPPPGEAHGLVVAFEDPSCPACGRFERDVYPTLAADLFDPGTATFVFRGIPVVKEWGTPATRALESAFARDEAAFRALKAHYYAEQSSFTTDNVYPRTREFLATNTGVDAGRVVREARQQEHDDDVRTDLDAARNVGLRGTPTFYLFADGEFRTDVVGPQKASVFEEALGV
jgi:protein-disulfide isomerase